MQLLAVFFWSFFIKNASFESNQRILLILPRALGQSKQNHRPIINGLILISFVNQISDESSESTLNIFKSANNYSGKLKKPANLYRIFFRKQDCLHDVLKLWEPLYSKNSQLKLTKEYLDLDRVSIQRVDINFFRETLYGSFFTISCKMGVEIETPIIIKSKRDYTNGEKKVEGGHRRQRSLGSRNDFWWLGNRGEIKTNGEILRYVDSESRRGFGELKVIIGAAADDILRQCTKPPE